MRALERRCSSPLFSLSPIEVHSIAVSLSACLSVCSCLSKIMCLNFSKFSVLWLPLRSDDNAVWCILLVLWWCHIFSYWPGTCNSNRACSTETVWLTREQTLWTKSDIYCCFVCIDISQLAHFCEWMRTTEPVIPVLCISVISQYVCHPISTSNGPQLVVIIYSSVLCVCIKSNGKGHNWALSTKNWYKATSTKHIPST